MQFDTNDDVSGCDNFNIMSSLEEQLMLSQLPYPKYYNGYTWNTVVANTRKHIPHYLQDDLPKLKFEPLREEFKKLNIIQCPHLTYFHDHIIKHKHKDFPPEHPKSSLLHHRQRQQVLEDQLNHIRKELQYALLTSDRNSNVIKKLIAKAATLQEELVLVKKKTGKGKVAEKKRSQSLAGLSLKERCFENTLDIVISARKELAGAFGQQTQEGKEEIKIKAVLLPFIE